MSNIEKRFTYGCVRVCRSVWHSEIQTSQTLIRQLFNICTHVPALLSCQYNAQTNLKLVGISYYQCTYICSYHLFLPSTITVDRWDVCKNRSVSSPEEFCLLAVPYDACVCTNKPSYDFTIPYCLQGGPCACVLIGKDRSISFRPVVCSFPAARMGSMSRL